MEEKKARILVCPRCAGILEKTNYLIPDENRDPIYGECGVCWKRNVLTCYEVINRRALAEKQRRDAVKNAARNPGRDTRARYRERYGEEW